MEFIISTDLEKSIPAVIDFNFDELKNGLSEQLAYYNSLVITPDGIKGGKEDRAKLNKLKTAVDDRRKEVKRLCLAPYEDFEIKCKTLTGMIDTASGSIDKQVKAFEDAEKEEKRARIEAVFNSSIGSMASFLKFHQIFNSRWLNATYKESDAALEIETAITRCNNDVSAIRGIGSDFETELLEQYAQGSGLSTVLLKAAALKERKQDEERRKEAPPSTLVTTRPVPPLELVTPPPDEPEAPIQVDFRVWATKRQLSALRAFLLSIDIKYGKVD